MSLPLKTVMSDGTTEAARQAVLNAISPYADRLGGAGMLAVVSHLVGQLCAMQDQRVVTPADCMRLVSENMQQGNRDAVAHLLQSEGTA